MCLVQQEALLYI